MQIINVRSYVDSAFFRLAAVCIVGTFLTFAIVGWLRHRSYLKHRGSGFVPSTQEIVVVGLFIAGLLEIAAVLFLILALFFRS
ncbi:MAG: hypothetical protein ABI353_11275 [Isosphaeraceae bacterium]